MDHYVPFGKLRVHRALATCVAEQVAPGTGITPEAFWAAFESLLVELAPTNRALLRKRDAIQAQIDAWVLERKGQTWNTSEYEAFLTKIGYLLPEAKPFRITSANVDAELSSTPGPQLVVPADNARYALNAANARWGSLLDAFYGTDAGPPTTGGAERTKAYNPVRGQRVFEHAHAFLDTHCALAAGAKYGDTLGFAIDKAGALECELSGGRSVSLKDPSMLVGYQLSGGAGSALKSALLRHNGLHVEIVFDRASAVGKTHPAGITDVLLEAAISTIIDFEDSVSAVDAEDKAHVYANWAGLMRGDLQFSFSKGGRTVTRTLRHDKTFVRAGSEGGTMKLKGRSLLLVRNVSLHMYSDAVLDAAGQPVPEGMLDAMVSTLGALHDLKAKPSKPFRNSRSGSMYIVKPKMHGPEEVAFTDLLMSRVESSLGLKPYTIKIGIMDEERRTSVNLAECIRQAQHRCIFINTGFLDRTGDEIHTSFMAGPMLPKAGIKKALWRTSYEDMNVDVGIAAGLPGVGQIGKGMWAAPDNMAEMLRTKMGHPKAGATCAWVPSPTAATLHAIHYHQVDVLDVQSKMAAAGPRAKVSDVLVPPFLGNAADLLSAAEIAHEVETNVQAILGYVLRWVELGVGCSKVPDLEDVGLMEDRATLRIASQHVANWLWHGVVTKGQVHAVFQKMARIVDKQNGREEGDALAMSNGFSNNPFKASLALVFEGHSAANGLTEPVLHRFRRMEKERQRQQKAAASRL